MMDTDCDMGTFCVMDDDTGPGFCSLCEPCTPDAMCENTCTCFEICFSGFMQPGCTPAAPTPASPDGGTDAAMPSDMAVPDGGPMCPGTTTCGTLERLSRVNEGCQGGCCVPQCPAGVTACVDTNDCPNAIELCVTGCCISIG